jgi:dihydrofolate reductase
VTAAPPPASALDGLQLPVAEPSGGNDDVGYGAREAGRPPFFVVTSSPPEAVRLTELDWAFVTTGVADAIAAARQRAEAASFGTGQDLDVVLMGGGALIGSALVAGLVDSLSLHLSPVLVGAGTPLFTEGPPRKLVAARRGGDVNGDTSHLRRGSLTTDQPRSTT